MGVITAALTAPLLLNLVAFWGPEINASSRSEAMDMCERETGKMLDKAMRQENLAKTKPYLNDAMRSDWPRNFPYPWLMSDEGKKITTLRAYCKPFRTRFPGVWGVQGYFEWLEQPTWGEAEVDRTMILPKAGGEGTIRWKERH